MPEIPTLDSFVPSVTAQEHTGQATRQRAKEAAGRALEYYYANREEVLRKQKAYREQNPATCRERVQAANNRNRGKRPSDYGNNGRDRYLRRKYGISAAEYDALLEKQRGRCAICSAEGGRIFKRTGRRKRLAIDHCHRTGRVRGLLCEACNTSIGLLRESTVLLLAALEYLRAHR